MSIGLQLLGRFFYSQIDISVTGEKSYSVKFKTAATVIFIFYQY